MQFSTDDNSATLHALFPTLVYQAGITDDPSYPFAFENEAEQFQFQVERGTGGKHFAGEYHGKILLHQQESLQPFFRTLAEHVSKYLRVLGMKPEFFEMQCLKSWFVLCEPSAGEDDAMMSHNHSCSDISWVYYVDVPNNGGGIRFHAGQRLSTAPFGSAFHYDWHDEQKSAVNKLNCWNRDTWSIQPKAGDLMMFPGHQLHSIDANHSETTRISVAGDIALVLREEYLNLEFGRTAPKHWLPLPLTERRVDDDS